jgi:hypothetical protein
MASRLNPSSADRLLQGMQGLVLHLHAISSDLPVDQPIRLALERWLLSADHLVDQGCADGVVQGQRGPLGAVAQLMDLVAVGQALPQPLHLRVQLGQAPHPLRDGVQQAIGQLACDHARNACREAGATAVVVQLDARHDGLTLRVRDNGRWSRPRPASAPLRAAVDPARAALRAGAARLGARLRLWQWPGTGGELQLQVPALRAYNTVEDVN